MIGLPKKFNDTLVGKKYHRKLIILQRRWFCHSSFLHNMEIISYIFGESIFRLET